jgi:DMSO/TMAO reductase YedYZ molybdopterin-dependent catalytic subunit
MEQTSANKFFPTVGDGSGLAHSDELYKEELQLALRNRGMPLEALRYPITPTGLHYLLIHYDIPDVNADKWRLKLGGLVAKPVELSLEEIKKRPRRTIPVTMECAGNGRALFAPRRISQPWLLDAIGNSEWTGTALKTILQDTGLRADAVEIVFTGVDRGVEGDQIQFYQRSLTVDEAMRDDVLLVYEMNGEPLPLQHGYPLRLLMPGWYGMASVKWLERIEAVREKFAGYQMARAYRYSETADGPGEAVTLIRARALMIPPGIPDFMTRNRLVDAGPVTLSGKAWAGRVGVSRVDVSVDGGSSWSGAELGVSGSPYAWRTWSFTWNAKPGEHVLCVRATDSEGNMQPADQQWNYGGYGNNGVQRVRVLVR